MRDTLIDIRNRLAHGEYKNEEHVRLSLVCRLLKKIGWDIWNPSEVNTEYSANLNEDNAKVDIALFVDDFSIFVEVKAVGKIQHHLADVEKQVRDYNRNHTALFSVITDGRSWYLYYSQTGGKFSQKLFKQYDLLNDNIEEVENTFSLFFSKENIKNGRAEEQAKEYLQLTNKEKAVQNALPQAKRLALEHPYPTLLDAILQVLTDNNSPHRNVSKADIVEILKQMPKPSPTSPAESVVMAHPKSLPAKWGISPLPIGKIPKNKHSKKFKHAKAEGTINGERGNNWTKLVGIAIKLAIQAGLDLATLRACQVNIKEGHYEGEGYKPVQGCNLSLQGMDADGSERALRLIAGKINCKIELTVTWKEKSPRAGEQETIQYP